MRILVTAFGPFGHFDRNPSELVLNRVRERYEASRGHVVDWMVLPVAFADIARLSEQIPKGFPASRRFPARRGRLLS